MKTKTEEFVYFHLFPAKVTQKVSPPEGFKLVAIISSGDAGVNLVYQKS
jgi:hypothetical protein